MRVPQLQGQGARQRIDVFLYVWLCLYFLGTLAGLYGGKAALLANESTLSQFCASVFRTGSATFFPLFLSSFLFLLLTVLVTQLPGGRAVVLLLVFGKAFSTAYVFSIFYLLREQQGLTPAVTAVALHSVFLLPAFYFLTARCRRGQLSGKGPYWFRYRIAPVVGTFVYMGLAIVLETYLLNRMI